MRFALPEGFTVKFEHRQFKQLITVTLTSDDWQDHDITPRGYTYCELFSPGGVLVSSGIAWCRDTDQFNKSIGRQISQGRAVKAFRTGKGFQKQSEKTMIRIVGQMEQPKPIWNFEK